MTSLAERRNLILELAQRPVAYMPAFARLAGSVTAGVFLSQAVYWTGRGREDGWFWKTADEWKEETCLSYGEQATARKRLKTLRVLEEHLRGVPAKLWYRVNLDRLQELLLDPKASIEETSKLDMPNPETLLDGNPRTTSDTTSEITSESVAQTPAPSGATVRAPEPEPEPAIITAPTSDKPIKARAKSTDVGSLAGEQQAMVRALAQVCKVDVKIGNGRLQREAKALREADNPVTPAEVRAYYAPGGVWYRHHWKGQKGDPPAPEDVGAWIVQAREHSQAQRPKAATPAPSTPTYFVHPVTGKRERV